MRQAQFRQSTTRGAVIGLLLFWFWRGYTDLRRPAQAARPADWALALAVGIAVFLAWIWLDQDRAVLSRSAGYMPLREDGSVDKLQALARLAGFALVVPVMEAPFWRSLVLRWIERHEFQSLARRRDRGRGVQVVPHAFRESLRLSSRTW